MDERQQKDGLERSHDMEVRLAFREKCGKGFPRKGEVGFQPRTKCSRLQCVQREGMVSVASNDKNLTRR